VALKSASFVQLHYVQLIRRALHGVDLYKDAMCDECVILPYHAFSTLLWHVIIGKTKLASGYVLVTAVNSIMSEIPTDKKAGFRM
jgi:predicted secreted protein